MEDCNSGTLWGFKPKTPETKPGGGRSLSEEQQEQEYLAELKSAADPRSALWKLSCLYTRTWRPMQSLDCLENLLFLAQDIHEQSCYLLKMGCNHEQLGDFRTAIGYYRRTLALEPADPGLWYYLLNNLGFCLNNLGRVTEGEFYCRQAIRTDPARYDAYKNLGLSLVGQGRLREAARAFISGTRADASDGRAFSLLQSLLAEHPELQEEFALESKRCEDAVRLARQKNAAIWRSLTQ